MRTSLKTLLSLAVAATLVAAPNAFAGHGRWGHGWHGDRGDFHGWHDHGRGHDRGHYRGHYDRFGNWVAGAIVTGAIVGLIADATAPRTVYYGTPDTVYYAPPPRTVVYRGPTVVYEGDPDVDGRRVYETTRVYETPPPRYVRDDGWDDDDGD